MQFVLQLFLSSQKWAQCLDFFPLVTEDAFAWGCQQKERQKASDLGRLRRVTLGSLYPSRFSFLIRKTKIKFLLNPPSSFCEAPTPTRVKAPRKRQASGKCLVMFPQTRRSEQEGASLLALSLSFLLDRCALYNSQSQKELKSESRFGHQILGPHPDN